VKSSSRRRSQPTRQLTHRFVTERTRGPIDQPVWARTVSKGVSSQRPLRCLGEIHEMAEDVSNPPPGTPRRLVERSRFETVHSIGQRAPTSSHLGPDIHAS
jgi:hypothetical protein